MEQGYIRDPLVSKPAFKKVNDESHINHFFFWKKINPHPTNEAINKASEN